MILPNGTAQNDPGYNFYGYHFADLAHPHEPHDWMTFPLMCVLIEHPEAGYILYDTGCALDADKTHRAPEHTAYNPSFISREEYVDERLKQVGLSVNDISTIIISHCHWDHLGGLHFFQGTEAIKNVYVSRNDFALGLLRTHQTSKGYIDSLYYRIDFEVEGAEFHYVHEDMDLFPGIHLLLLRGHTPGTIGLRLDLESGTYIFPSDELPASVHYYEPATKAGSYYDSLAAEGTLRRIRQMEKDYKANLIFWHDPWSFENYKKMEWYE